MPLADFIIDSIDKKLSFDKLRIKMKKNNIPKEDFKNLVKLVENEPLEVLSVENLTMNEQRIVGKALLAAKLKNINEIIVFLIENDTKRTSMILNDLLNKNCKLENQTLQIIQAYLKEAVSTENVFLNHYKLLLIISKNYSSLIDMFLINFCKMNTHPICKKILLNMSITN